MDVAIVILNWNGKALLEQFLPSIINHSEKATIYVADNCSTDDSLRFLTREYPQIKVLVHSNNYGFAKGYNLALKKIEADIYVLVNSDIEVTKGWLDPVIKQFNSNDDVAIIQPKILDYKKDVFFEYAGAAGGYIDRYGYPFCRGRLFDHLEEDKGQYDDDTTIFWASGACFFIRKSIFDKLGGFDVDFFAHQEEIDLCWRANNRGYKCLYVGASKVYHVGGATLQEGSYQKIYLNFRNNLYLLLKNLPKEKLLRVLFIRMILDGVAGIRFLLKGEIKSFFAILKSHFDFYCKSISMYKKREDFQRRDYYKINSVVKQYFLGKKKQFSQLK